MSTLTNRYVPSTASFHFDKWMDEHQQFLAYMKEFRELSTPILQGDSNYKQYINMLYNKVKIFSERFLIHTAEEESLLKPQVVSLIIEKNEILYIFTCEHEQIFFHLKAFLNCAKPRATSIPLAAAKSLIFHIQELEEKITSHIYKEETLIYPLFLPKNQSHVHRYSTNSQNLQQS